MEKNDFKVFNLRGTFTPFVPFLVNFDVLFSQGYTEELRNAKKLISIFDLKNQLFVFKVYYLVFEINPLCII